MPYQSQIAEAKAALEGKTISLVKQDLKNDEGLVIEFTDGTVLQCSYNSGEGATSINGKQIAL